MQQKEQICYEQTYCKLKYKFRQKTKFCPRDLEISDVEREIGYCRDSKQYIMRYIELLKDKVIRYLPHLNDVKIMLGIYDKDNILHHIMVGIYCLVRNRVETEIAKNYLYESIFTVIQYKGEVVFVGSICFHGIL